ncbi:MAG: NAD(P)H-dependent oxidoreductase [Oscillospiraceae bacterium]|nr:NAD(P)H-dependent oxidoreductase [Oscillospiraceae bacterium]
MKVLIINATMREESGYNAARVLSEMIAGEQGVIYEVFLPKNLPDFCVGCYRCFDEGEQHCPHSKYVDTIRQAMDDSQVFVFAAPVYGRRIPAALKNFFDHLYYQWVFHRPKAEMWNKQAVVLISNKMAGAKQAANDIRDNLKHWGVARIHCATFKTDCQRFSDILPFDKVRIGHSLEKITKKILKHTDTPPSLSSKLVFHTGRLYQKLKNKNKRDTDYWGEKGWLDVIRPWYVKRLRK